MLPSMEKKDPNSSSSSSSLDTSPKDDNFLNILSTLEQQPSWNGHTLVKYHGFWYPIPFLRQILHCHKHFQPKSTDIIVASLPKSGTTWLKAITFAIANRNNFTSAEHPLLTANPHTLVPFFDFGVYSGQENHDSTPSPRILATHVPFDDLAESIIRSECRIIYICRNPLDQFISHYHFLVENNTKTQGVLLDLPEAFDKFCEGVQAFGPCWDHELGYWNAHLRNPQRILFLKYEDLKDDVTSYVRKIADFMGFPFSLEEERSGAIEQIITLCSFEKLRSLQVNKTGILDFHGPYKHSSFFRKGIVGGWKNYLTPTMAERVENIMKIKFEGSSLSFKF